MLYTSMPLERIYKNQVNSLIIPRTPVDLSYQQMESNKSLASSMMSRGYNGVKDIRTIEIPHGRIYAIRQGEQYVVDSIHSTNLEDYLTSRYQIGNVIEIP